jgi:stearoyl-CoA desaturase (delta-9 desaturase)
MHFASMIGITVGFHRYGAHRSFDCGSVTRSVLVALGSMAAQGPLVHWVSNHRRHHQFSDKAGDVHSPWQPEHGGVRGFWHAHLGWMFKADVTNPVRYSRDLLQDPALMRMNRAYVRLVLLGLVGPALLVLAWTSSVDAAIDTLLWAGFVRIFVAHHVTWCINSVAHLRGSRMFRSPDNSVNVAWLAVPSAGESWHNGHHAFPGSARFGYAWYQIDLGYLLIRLLEAARLASGVNRPSQAAIRKARLSRGALPTVAEGE